MATRTSGPVKTAEQQEKLDAKENWYKLVVKIIVWKDAARKNDSSRLAEKITAKEWDAYSKGLLKTNVSYDKQRVLTQLKEVKEIIKSQGGFADDVVFK